MKTVADSSGFDTWFKRHEILFPVKILKIRNYHCLKVFLYVSPPQKYFTLSKKWRSNELFCGVLGLSHFMRGRLVIRRCYISVILSKRNVTIGWRTPSPPEILAKKAFQIAGNDTSRALYVTLRFSINTSILRSHILITAIKLFTKMQKKSSLVEA